MARMSEVVVGRPGLGLSPFVRRYIGYRQTGLTVGLHRGLPSRYLTFVVSLDQPIQTIVPSHPNQSPLALQGLVCGLHTRAALIRRADTEHGIAVEMTPLAARAVFGLPAIELTATIASLDDLLGRRAAGLIERLIEAPSWKRRFGILDGLLSAGLDDSTGQVPQEVKQAWVRLTDHLRADNLEGLAADLGWSRRHLTKRFHEEAGLPPRQLRRVIRFERSLTLLRCRRQRTLAEVAASTGFYDQSHMLHEWKDLAGCTPSAWVAEELPSVHHILDVAEEASPL